MGSSTRSRRLTEALPGATSDRQCCRGYANIVLNTDAADRSNVSMEQSFFSEQGYPPGKADVTNSLLSAMAALGLETDYIFVSDQRPAIRIPPAPFGVPAN
jgi:hypothetical protein